MRAYPLHNEFTDQDQATNDQIYQMLERDRSGCAKRGLFTPWQQGFTPKDHREWTMMDRKWAMEREDRRDKEQREWQERMEAGRHRSTLFWLGLVATVIIAAATIGAAFIERGGQPTIINNIPAPQDSQFTPSTSDIPVSQP